VRQQKKEAAQTFETASALPLATYLFLFLQATFLIFRVNCQEVG
jgi:hypothetical protein